MDGILNIYKEQGYTSFDVVAKLRGILKMKKIGHTGTLDPMAEGVLLVCLGKATKLVDILTSKDKEYETIMRLGYETDTEDITGKIITPETDICSLEVLNSRFDENAILSAVNSYVGEYEQIPPMYSAIKKDGKKLYEYARAGIEIEREARPVTIHSISDINICMPDISFNVFCSKGTYIRSLCRDIGRTLGCGATLAGLKRSKVNKYSVDDALSLTQVEELCKEGRIEEFIIPMDELLSMYKRASVKESGRNYIINGNKLTKSMLSDIEVNQNEIIRVYLDNSFIALYQYIEKENIFKPFKMFL